MATPLIGGKFYDPRVVGLTPGGALYTYAAGSLTPLATFTDAGGLSSNANPVICNVYGQVDVFLGTSAYRFRLYTDLIGNGGTLLWDEDNISSTSGLIAQIANTAIVTQGAGMVGFNPTLNYTSGTIGATFIDWNPKDFPWLAKFDGATDDTAALLACMTAIYAAGGGTMRCPRGTSRVTSLVFNWSAAKTVNIVGAGEQATYFQKLGATTTPVFDFSVDVGVLDVYCTFRDFAIVGNAKTHHGFRATRLSNITTENTRITACDVGFESVGCLVSRHIRPAWESNNIGFRCRKSGTIYCNLVEIQAGAVRSNTTFGADIGEASEVKWGNTNFASNGTAANTATGGMMIRSTVSAEIGYSIISFEGTWFEANLGRTFQTEAATGLYLTMRAVNLLTPETNRSANIGAIAGLTMIDCNAPSAGDTVVTAAVQSTIVGGLISTITDTGTSRLRMNVGTSAGLTKFGASNCGTAVLVAGVKAVAYAPLKAGDQVFALSQVDGGAPGGLRVTSKTNGVGFTISSTSGTDTSTVAWFVVEAV